MDLIFGLCVATGAGCLVALVVVLAGGRVFPERRQRRTRGSGQLSTTTLAGVTIGLVVAAATRSVAAALAVGAAIALLPWLLGGGKAAAAQMAKIEALAVWTESLRDTASSSAGLEEAIPATVDQAPALLRPALRSLRARIALRVPLPDALSEFADDVDDPLADQVAAALALNATMRDRGLRRVLGELAESTRAELEMHRRIDKQRGSTRWQQTGVLLVVGGFVLVQWLVMGSWTAPYRAPLGQVVLVILTAAFMGTLAWMRRLAEPVREPRFLAAPDDVRAASEYRPRVGGRS